MIKKDFHIHSFFSDGIDDPEDVITEAIMRSMTVIGFSDHSYTDFDESYCIKKELIETYKAEINRLKDKYRDDITVLCGVEQDYYSNEPTAGFDYVIGSVHYVKSGDVYTPVDLDPDTLLSAADKYFGGDIYALIENYYHAVGKIAERINADIIGHFDLITKFNEKTPLFDTQNPRYIKAWKTAVDKLIPYNIPFEINTGAISRGYRTTPYPGDDIKAYIENRGGSFIYSSDAHKKEDIMYNFPTD